MARMHPVTDVPRFRMNSMHARAHARMCVVSAIRWYIGYSSLFFLSDLLRNQGKTAQPGVPYLLFELLRSVTHLSRAIANIHR